MTRLHLDVTYLHQFLIPGGRARDRLSRASVAERFHLAVHIPLYRRWNVGDGKRAVLLCTDSHLAIRASNYIESRSKTASLCSDQTDLGTANRLAVGHQTTTNESSFGHRYSVALSSCGHDNELGGLATSFY